MSVYTNELTTPGESLKTRNTIPEDFHWEDLVLEPFLGEIYDTENDKYYSRSCGRKYRPKSKQRHLDEGHFQGYSYGIEHFCPEGGIVLDPFVGSGTALIEAYLQGRNSIGIEVEFNQLLEDNINHIKENYPREATIEVVPGDCREVLPTLKQEIDLVITGFPYPIISGNITADAPMYPIHNGGFEVREYNADKSLGRLHWKKDFRPEMCGVLTKCGDQLKIGGRLITLIKDCVNKKAPFFLQRDVTEDFLRENPNFEIEGWYLHRHTPETMFMRSYPKRYPGVKIPLYQVGLVLIKKY